MPVRLSSVQLVRFAKVSLRAGASTTVQLSLLAKDLGYWDDGLNGRVVAPARGGWAVDPGEFELVAATDGFGSWAQLGGLHTTVQVLPAP